MGLLATTLREGTEAMAEETGMQPLGKIVPLVWSEAGMAVLANHAFLQFDGSLVYLTFGQANPPVVLGETEEEKRQQLDKVHSITVSPVIRIAMPPENFRALTEALQKHLALVEKVEKSKRERK